MSGNFGRNVFASAARVGGVGSLFDFLDDADVVAGDAGGAVTDGTAPATKAPPQSPGAIPKFDTCVKPYIDDPKNPTSFCILDPKGSYTCPANQIYDPVKKGCVPYKPDLIEGAQPQTGVICPYGTKAIGKACVSLVGGGAASGGGGTKLAPPAPFVPDPTNGLTGTGGVPTWAIVLGGVTLVALVGGAVVAKQRQGARGKRR